MSTSTFWRGLFWEISYCHVVGVIWSIRLKSFGRKLYSLPVFYSWTEPGRCIRFSKCADIFVLCRPWDGSYRIKCSVVTIFGRRLLISHWCASHPTLNALRVVMVFAWSETRSSQKSPCINLQGSHGCFGGGLFVILRLDVCVITVFFV